jgi:hypothetical protein
MRRQSDAADFGAWQQLLDEPIPRADLRHLRGLTDRPGWARERELSIYGRGARTANCPTSATTGHAWMVSAVASLKPSSLPNLAIIVRSPLRR